MLNKKSSEKVDRVVKELIEVLHEDYCLVCSSNIEFNENSSNGSINFDLNISLNGLMHFNDM